MDPILAAFEFTRPLFDHEGDRDPRKLESDVVRRHFCERATEAGASAQLAGLAFEDPAELAARFAACSRRTGTSRSRRSGSGSSPGSPRLSRSGPGHRRRRALCRLGRVFASSPSRRKQGGIRPRPSASPPGLGDGRGSALTRPKRLRLAPPGGQLRPAVAARPRLPRPPSAPARPRSWRRS
jgi:hypothetical protein